MTERGFLYVAALPSFRYSAEIFTQYRIPYYAIIAAFVILALVSVGEGFPFAKKLKPWFKSVTVLILLFAAIFGVSKNWYRDGNFHKELAMNRAVEDLDWERVLTIARDGSSDVKPTRQMVLYKNLALFRL